MGLWVLVLVAEEVLLLQLQHGDLTKVSRETISDSSAEMMPCAAACCACNVLDSSTADSS